MMVGWIKLYRLLLESAVFQNAYALQVFIYLLLKATYKEMKVPVGNKNIVLQPGQLLYGRKVVSQRLNMGEGKLRGIMDYLVANGSIEMESHSKYSVVTIVNWEQYQIGEVPEFPFDVDFLDDEEEELEVEPEPSKANKIDPFEISWDGYKDWKEESYGEEFWNKVWGKDKPENQTEKTAETARTARTEPAENQMQIQTQTDFQESDFECSASREPQYNNINKNKYNNIIKNKTRENKTKENHKNLGNIENIENTKNHSYRQSDDIVDELSHVERVAGLGTSQEMLLSDGDGVAKGKVVCEDSANSCDADCQVEAFTALADMDDAALDAYFASCSFADFGRNDFGANAFDANTDTGSVNFAPDTDDACPYKLDFDPIPLDETDLPVSSHSLDNGCRPGYDFVSEMVYDLTPRDIEQLDTMFRCYSVAAVRDLSQTKSAAS